MSLFQSKSSRKPRKSIFSKLELAMGMSYRTDGGESDNVPKNDEITTKGVLLGWRYWNIQNDKLLSPYIGHLWEKHLMSVDSLERDQGLYAYHSFNSIHPTYMQSPIVGLVAASGDMELHETGFRAKNVQILALSPGRRFNYDFSYNYDESVLHPNHNLQTDLELEGKEEVVFCEDVFSLINFGIDLAEKEEFTLEKLDDQKARRPRLISSKTIGEDTILEYKLGKEEIHLKK